MFRSLLSAAFLVGTAFPGAAAARPYSNAPDDADQASPLDDRELAAAMFEAARADPKQIVRQKLETARREYWFQSGWCGFDTSLSRFDPGWSQRLLAAELAVYKSPAEQAAAYKRYWQSAWERERLEQSKYDAGRINIPKLMAARAEARRAEMDWARARAKAGKVEPRARATNLPIDLSEPNSFLKAEARAQFEAMRSDLGELARQRIEAARAAHRARLIGYMAGRTRYDGEGLIDDLLESDVLVAQAELDVPGGKVDAAAVRERTWEMAWMAHEISCKHFQTGRMSNDTDLAALHADLAASRYALIEASMALLQAGQVKRPGRIGSLLYEPALAREFNSKAFARARAEVGQTDLDDLLRQRLETARTGYRLRWEAFCAGKIVLDSLLLWSPRLLESELALATSQAARDAAHVRHWKRVWQIEAIARSKFEAGRGTLADMLLTRLARLDAELLWAQARQARK